MVHIRNRWILKHQNDPACAKIVKVSESSNCWSWTFKQYEKRSTLQHFPVTRSQRFPCSHPHVPVSGSTSSLGRLLHDLRIHVIHFQLLIIQIEGQFCCRVASSGCAMHREFGGEKFGGGLRDTVAAHFHVHGLNSVCQRGIGQRTLGWLWQCQPWFSNYM